MANKNKKEWPIIKERYNSINAVRKSLRPRGEQIFAIWKSPSPQGAGNVSDNMIFVDHIIRYHPCCK